MACLVNSKILSLGLQLSLILAVAVAGSVTVYNPSKLLANVFTDAETVTLQPYIPVVIVDFNQAEQKIQIVDLSSGNLIAEVDVKDGDIIVLIVDPLGGGILALKVQNMPILAVLPPKST